MVNGMNATTGAQFWTMATDYVLPPHNWTPPMGVTLTPGDGAVVVPGAGGTVWVRTNPNAAKAAIQRRVAFYGMKYLNQNPEHSTTPSRFARRLPSTTSATFISATFRAASRFPVIRDGIPSGLARVGLDGTGTFVAASALAGDPQHLRRSSTIVPRPYHLTVRRCTWR